MKLAGMMLLTVCALCLGAYLRREERQRVQAVGEALSLVRYVRRKIEYFSSPLPEILAEYEAETGRHFSGEGGALSFPEAAAPLAGRMGDAGDLLLSFAAEIGGGYREETLALCACTEERLAQYFSEAEAAYPARARLYGTLPLLAAFAVMIVFV